MNFKTAITQAMTDAALTKSTVFIGYNLKYGSRGYGTLSGVPQEKIIEMPVAEALMSGVAIGLSLGGYIPILIFERHDFMLLGLDALVNHLDKFNSLSNGQFNPKVIIRAIIGGTKPFNPGDQHNQDFTPIFKGLFNFPVLSSSLPQEIISYYSQALLSNTSTMIIENRDSYAHEHY